MRFHRLRAGTPAFAAAVTLLLSVALPAHAEDAPADDPVEAVVNGVELRRSAVLESARDLPRAYQDQIEQIRSEEHTSELQSLMRISYAVFCLKKKKKTSNHDSIMKQLSIAQQQKHNTIHSTLT